MTLRGQQVEIFKKCCFNPIKFIIFYSCVETNQSKVGKRSTRGNSTSYKRGLEVGSIKVLKVTMTRIEFLDISFKNAVPDKKNVLNIINFSDGFKTSANGIRL